MELHGKCKKDFNKWFKITGEIDIYETYDIESYNAPDAIDIEMVWDRLPLSMQYGVHVDFFDSVGINITVNPIWSGDNVSYFFIIDPQDVISDDDFDTRQEARTNAIKLANLIYNKQ